MTEAAYFTQFEMAPPAIEEELGEFAGELNEGPGRDGDSDDGSYHSSDDSDYSPSEESSSSDESSSDESSEGELLPEFYEDFKRLLRDE